MSAEPRESPGGLDRFGPFVLLLLGLALLVLSSRHKRLSNDEWFNLDYGRSFLEEGPRLQASPHLPSLALNALACLPEKCDRASLDRDGPRRMLVRAPSMAFTLLLGWLVYSWARELLGRRPALLALLLYVFNPNFLAHGKEVTGDVATSFFTLLAAYGAWVACERSAFRGISISSLGLAGALLSKYTSLILIPLLGVAVLWRAFKGGTLRPGRVILGALAVLLLALVLVNVPYGFGGCGTLAKDYPFESRALKDWGGGAVPIPLPRAYVLGFDFLLLFQEQPTLQRGMNYALGHLSWKPLWYAFPLMFLLKTPLGFFGLLLIGGFRGGLPQSARVFLALPCAGILFLFAVFVGPQMGVRYLLPAFPFLMIAAAQAGRPPLSQRTLVATSLLALWNVVSTLSYHPHYVCYFNELIGSRLHAYRFLADSNLDWEDRSFFIGEFVRSHPELTIAVDPPSPRPGYVLVGANKLVGILDRRRYRWLRRNFEPIAHVGYSYLLFYVPPERLREILEQAPSREEPAGVVTPLFSPWPEG
jgi:hypothetical protein